MNCPRCNATDEPHPPEPGQNPNWLTVDVVLSAVWDEKGLRHDYTCSCGHKWTDLISHKPLSFELPFISGSSKYDNN